MEKHGVWLITGKQPVTLIDSHVIKPTLLLQELGQVELLVEWLYIFNICAESFGAVTKPILSFIWGI